MGLDQYLNSRRVLSPTRRADKKLIKFLNNSQDDFRNGVYISAWSSSPALLEMINSTRLYGQVGDIKNITLQNGCYRVDAESLYWRKCNAIHQWFVTNVQNEVDDCGEYELTRDHLENLVDDINSVLRSRKKACELLPTQSGFFFGDTEYDSYYFEQLRNTRNRIKALLKPSTLKNWSLSYSSSW